MNLIEQIQAMTVKDIAAKLKSVGMRCNCDLDNWEPEIISGHSYFCRIHKAATTAKYRPYDMDADTLSRIKGE